MFHWFGFRTRPRGRCICWFGFRILPPRRCVIWFGKAGVNYIQKSDAFRIRRTAQTKFPAGNCNQTHRNTNKETRIRRIAQIPRPPMTNTKCGFRIRHNLHTKRPHYYYYIWQFRLCSIMTMRIPNLAHWAESTSGPHAPKHFLNTAKSEPGTCRTTIHTLSQFIPHRPSTHPHCPMENIVRFIEFQRKDIPCPEPIWEELQPQNSHGLQIVIGRRQIDMHHNQISRYCIKNADLIRIWQTWNGDRLAAGPAEYYEIQCIIHGYRQLDARSHT